MEHWGHAFDLSRYMSRILLWNPGIMPLIHPRESAKGLPLFIHIYCNNSFVTNTKSTVTLTKKMLTFTFFHVLSPSCRNKLAENSYNESIENEHNS